MKRKMVLPSLHDRVGKHSRPREAARNRERERLGHENFRFSITDAIFANELSSNDACDDESRGPSLERLAHVLSDALESIEPFSLDFERKYRDFNTGQMLRERLASRWLATLVRWDLLLFVSESECSIEIGLLATIENERKHVERKLRAVAAQLL